MRQKFFSIWIGLAIVLVGTAWAQQEVLRGGLPVLAEGISSASPAAAYVMIEVPKSFDTYVENTMRTWGVHALSGAIVREDEVNWYRPYGVVNTISAAPVSPDAVFLLGDLSETVIATALLQLMEQGHFELDDPINRYLEEPIHHPRSPKLVTFKMLLTHTGGIRDDGALGGMTQGDPTESIHETVWGYFLPRGKYYDPDRNFGGPPGGEYAHSYMGMVLAARLVEEISGQDLESYCQEHIFGPLGMTNTSWYYTNLNSSNVVHPYLAGSNLDLGNYHNNGWWPAANLKSSVPSMTRFLRALLQSGEYQGARILDVETIDKIFSPYVTVNASHKMGLGWMEYTSSAGEKLWYRYGSRRGVRSDITLSPDLKTGVVFLSNGDVDQVYQIDDKLYFEGRSWEPWILSCPTEVSCGSCEVCAEENRTCVPLFNLSKSPMQIEGIAALGNVRDFTPNGSFPVQLLNEFDCFSAEILFAPQGRGHREDKLIVFTSLENSREIYVPIHGMGVQVDPVQPGFYMSSSYLFRGKFERDDENPGFVATDVAPIQTGRIFRGLTVGPEGSPHCAELIGVAPKIGDPAVSELWRICCTTAQGLRLAEIAVPRLEGLAYLPSKDVTHPEDARIFALTDLPSSGGQLYSIDPTNGNETLVREYPSARFHALTMDRNGTLYASGRTVRGNDVIYTINPENGDTTYVGSTGLGKPILALAFGAHPLDFFGLQSEGVDPPSIIELNPFTAEVRSVHSTGFPGLQTLAFFDPCANLANSSLEEPEAITLYQNHPNPFNPTTTIRYQIPRASHVTLKVYNLLGQQVVTLVDEFQDAGYRSVEFRATEYASGVYVYQLTAAGYVETKKMLILR